MQLSSAVTVFQTEALAANRYAGTCRIPVTHFTHGRRREQNVIGLDSSHFSQHCSDQHRHPSPLQNAAEKPWAAWRFRQRSSPVTSCTVLVSFLNNKITSRIIQLLRLQPENPQTAVTIKMPFPSSEKHFTNNRQIFVHSVRGEFTSFYSSIESLSTTMSNSLL